MEQSGHCGLVLAKSGAFTVAPGPRLTEMVPPEAGEPATGTAPDTELGPV